MKKRKKVLNDHRQVRKKLIPPMLQALEEINFIKWLDKTLPELVWIAILLEQLGIQRTVQVCGAIAQAGKEVSKEKNINMALISNYRNFSIKELNDIASILNSKKIMDDLTEALNFFIALYPACPLSKLIASDASPIMDEGVSAFKPILEKYFNRRTHSTNVLEATALCMSQLSGCIKYLRGQVSPPDLNALLTENLDNDNYRRVASIVRATTLTLVKDVDEDWSRYFWNRGLEIDECE